MGEPPDYFPFCHYIPIIEALVTVVLSARFTGGLGTSTIVAPFPASDETESP